MGDRLRRAAAGVAVALVVGALVNGGTAATCVVKRATASAGGAACRRLAIVTPARGVLPDRLVAHPDRLRLRPAFVRWAGRYGVPAELLQAVAWQESGWQVRLVSGTGAVGVGQLMPDTVRFVSGRLLKTPLDPRVADDNIRMSARFLRYLLDTTGDRRLAVAAYYQGLRSVREQGVHPRTQHYVDNVLALTERFR